jgi:hypothetical protein
MAVLFAIRSLGLARDDLVQRCCYQWAAMTETGRSARRSFGPLKSLVPRSDENLRASYWTSAQMEDMDDKFFEACKAAHPEKITSISTVACTKNPICGYRRPDF